MPDPNALTQYCLLDAGLALLCLSYGWTGIIDQPLKNAGSFCVFLALSIGDIFFLRHSRTLRVHSRLSLAHLQKALLGFPCNFQQTLTRLPLDFCRNFYSALSLKITLNTILLDHHYSWSMSPICCARTPGYLSTPVHLSRSLAPICF